MSFPTLPARAAPTLPLRSVVALVLAIALSVALPPSAADARQTAVDARQSAPSAAEFVGAAGFSLDDILAPGFPYGVTAAGAVDRVAWMENERGRRNVYTAATPDFRAVRLTSFMADDGVDLSNLQISDDGSVVTFIRGHAPNRDGWIANPSSDPLGGQREIWAVGTDGGQPWRVVAALNQSLSPDGRWVLHVRDGQIHRAAVDPGTEPTVRPDEAPPLFRAFGQNGSPTWSPDGTRIAFVSQRSSHSFIGVYDTRSRTVRYMAPGVDRDASPVWSPDGERIAFLRRPGQPYGAQAEVPDGVDRSQLPEGLLQARFEGGYSLSLWITDVATGEGYELWHNPPEGNRFGDLSNLRWADGHLTFRSEPDNWRHYFSIPVPSAAAEAGRSGWATGPVAEPTLLTPGEGFVEEFALSPDGRHLYAATNIGDIDRRHIYRVPVGGGTMEPVTSGEGIETFPAVLASGDRVAHTVADARRPQSVAVTPASGGTPSIISPDLPSRFPYDRHVVPENVMVTAEDGLAFHNQLFLPPDLQPGEQRPALVFIHGGPRRQMLLGYNYGHFYHMAYAVNQYFANRGYIVLSVNFRSGIGYGREFREEPRWGTRGNEEYLDILAVGHYLADRDDVDASKIALWGLSYGGILTAQGLARDSDLFAAGVDIAGVHLWGNTLDPEAVSYQSSSIAYVDRWRSPVLLVHGDDDRNVAFSETVGLVQALRAHQVPHELIVFPDDVHSFLIHDRWVRTFEAMDDFLDRRLLGGDGVRANDR